MGSDFWWGNLFDACWWLGTPGLVLFASRVGVWAAGVFAFVCGFVCVVVGFARPFGWLVALRVCVGFVDWGVVRFVCLDG